jgi:extracellular factor (EF) 3-hydroxypalmitic acid methyl ester biosynthesis protein
MNIHVTNKLESVSPARRSGSQDARYGLDLDVRDLQAQALVHERIPATASSIIVDWCQRAHDCLARLAVTDPAGVKQWQELILPFFLKSSFLKRCHDKPQGYAGDYLTIQIIYDGIPPEADHFGRAVDIWTMGQPCTLAVRNRRLLVGNFVQNACRTFASPSVVSLGCGPAAEVFDLLGIDGASFTLVDIDADAINYVQEKARLHAGAARIDVMRGNIIKMVLCDEGRLPGNRAAFYSMGLIDYFNDDLVVRLLNYIHGKLSVGGAAFLGNFRPDHPNVALFQHALDWPLLLRSEHDLRRLVAKSRFGHSPVDVGTEPEGVQLFVKCTKLGC